MFSNRAKERNEHTGMGELFLEDFKCPTDVRKAIMWIWSIEEGMDPLQLPKGSLLPVSICRADSLMSYLFNTFSVLKKKTPKDLKITQENI